ncbi:hypothetical protein Scep_005594 [Stephania cephalantha]|uniref:C2H2-type domain-containing protein n=1 Tax=Stephania cephalantha TaxID=152367 RepID=A0AAP0KVI9_9MAGN
MAFIRPLINSFIYISLLLFHLGCFIIFPPTNPKKRKVSSSSSSSSKRTTNRFSHLKRLFCFRTPPANPKPPEIETLTIASARSSQHSIVSAITPADTIAFVTSSRPTHRRRRSGSIVSLSSDTADLPLDCSQLPSFTLRNDIFPCPTCGEIFQKVHLLDHHQSIKHAVSELFDGDSGKNIVQIIFTSGWTSSNNNNNNKKNAIIHRILKIHNSPKIVARFEEYRESVKAKASRIARKRDERCVADGNELLRFHCTTFMCNLGQNGNSSLCGQQYCSVCGIIRAGFSAKIDGIATLSNSWRAHVALPDGLEEEFGFMGVKRAMLICRVVAGRIGNDQGLADKDDVGFDSVVGRGEEVGGAHGSSTRVDEDELLVFNPRAVLPCFAIVYSVAV